MELLCCGAGKKWEEQKVSREWVRIDVTRIGCGSGSCGIGWRIFGRGAWEGSAGMQGRKDLGDWVWGCKGGFLLFYCIWEKRTQGKRRNTTPINTLEEKKFFI